MTEFDINVMFEEVNMGYLNFQKHPTHDLFIFNYSKTCQFEKYWTSLTLASRGLVLNSSSSLVARCLPKFFNVQELTEDVLPKTSFKVYEKLDGSYIQIFRYNDQIVFSSRGSFTSDQAIKAQQIFFEKYSHLSDQIRTGFNYVFEIIYPSNRIVVDYGKKEDLVLITVIENETKKDRLIDIGFPMVKEYSFADFETIKAMHIDNAEGFIIKYDSPNDIDPVRVKLKFAEYVRLHRILTTCSTRDLWNLLKNNGNLEEILERVPDEFYDWVEETITKLKTNYSNVEELCRTNYKPIQLLVWLRNLPQVTNKDAVVTKKQVAQYIKKQKYWPILFNMYYGMSYDKEIWDIVEPKWEKPFSKFIPEDEE